MSELFQHCLNMAPGAPDIAFHYYESLAKLVRKLDAHRDDTLRCLWTAVEEFRFMFDAEAVCLAALDREDGSKHRWRIRPPTPGCCWRVSNLAQRGLQEGWPSEQQILHDTGIIPLPGGRFAKGFVQTSPTENSVSTRFPPRDYSALGVIRWARSETPLGDREDRYRMEGGQVVRDDNGSTIDELLWNENLERVNSILEIILTPPEGHAWRLIALMDARTGEGAPQEDRGCVRFLDPLFRPPGSRVRSDKTGAAKLLDALQLVFLPFGSVESPKERQYAPHGANLQRTCERLKTVDPARFAEEYQRRFENLHDVLNVLYTRFDGLLRMEMEDTQDFDSTLTFSYRHKQDEGVYFLPPSNQVNEKCGKWKAEWKRNGKDWIEEFLEFIQFCYPRLRAPSGWVMATGLHDYALDFLDGSRWRFWEQSASEEQKRAIGRQRERVGVFLKANRESNLKHCCIVPILTVPMDATEQGDDPRVETVVMANITASRPLSRNLRRQLLDLAWSMSPAVDLALVAQREAEQRQEVSRRHREEELRRGLWHALPKFVFKPLEYQMWRLHRAHEAIAYHLTEGNASRQALQQAEKYRGRYVRGRAPGPPLKSFRGCMKAMRDAIEVQGFLIMRGSQDLAAFADTGEGSRGEIAAAHARSRTELASEVLATLGLIFKQLKDFYCAGLADAHDRRDAPTLWRDIVRDKLALRLPQDGQEWHVVGDRLSLLCHVENLLDNAVCKLDLSKALASGAGENPLQISFDVARDGNACTLTVTDYGFGMDEATRDRLECVFRGAGALSQFADRDDCTIALAELRQGSRSEGAGTGLRDFARYLRMLWAPYKQPDRVAEVAGCKDPTQLRFWVPLAG